MVEGTTTQESTEPPKKSLLRNWPLMSSIISYCVFSLHDTAYSEVPLTDHNSFYTEMNCYKSWIMLGFNIRYFLYGPWVTENMAGLALHLKMWVKFLRSQVIPLQPILPKYLKKSEASTWSVVCFMVIIKSVHCSKCNFWIYRQYLSSAQL